MNKNEKTDFLDILSMIGIIILFAVVIAFFTRGMCLARFEDAHIVERDCFTTEIIYKMDYRDGETYEFGYFNDTNIETVRVNKDIFDMYEKEDIITVAYYEISCLGVTIEHNVVIPTISDTPEISRSERGST